MQLGNRIGELTAAPVFQTVDATLLLFNKAAITFQHGRNLLALVRMNQKTDFIMTHCKLPVGFPVSLLNREAVKASDNPTVGCVRQG